MKNFVFIILIFANSLRGSYQNELSVTIDLAQELHFRHCVIVQNKTENDQELFLNPKRLSSQNIASTNLNYNELVIFVEQLEYLDFKMGFIFKEKNLDNLEKIFMEFFDEEDRILKLSLFIWIIFLEAPILDPNHNKLMVPYNSEFIVVQKGNDSFYKLTELFTFNNDTFTFNFGRWNKNGGLKVSDIPLPAKRIDFNGSTLTVLAISDILDPQICEEDPTVPSCQIYNVIKDISKAMNFMLYLNTYEFFDENSMKMNFTYFEVSSIEHRWNFDDPAHKQSSYPIFKMTCNWYIKYPETILRSDYFVQPFHRNFWLAIIFTILLGNMSVLSIVPTDHRSSFSDRIFMIFESFCNQSGSDKIDRIPLRIICILFRIAAIIVMASFGAVITSYLTIDIPQIPFTNEKEFIENGQYKLLLVMIEVDNSSFPIPVSKRSDIYNRTIIYDYESFINKFEKMLCGPDNNVVPFAEYRIYNYKRKCHLHQILKPLTSYYVSLEYLHPSSITYLMNFKIVRLHESGVQKKMQNFYSERPFTKYETENVFRPVEIEQMILVLCIPLIGILLAMLIFFGEIAMNKKNSRLGIITSK